MDYEDLLRLLYKFGGLRRDGPIARACRPELDELVGLGKAIDDPAANVYRATGRTIEALICCRRF